MDRMRVRQLETALEEMLSPAQVGLTSVAMGSSAFPQLMPSCDWRGTSPQDWLDCWSGLDHRARMVVTNERIYVAGDHRAEQAIVARQDLRLNSGRVELVDPTCRSELDNLVRVEEGEGRTICVRRRQRGGHLLMRASRLGGPPGVFLLGIAFWIADENFAVEWPDFRRIFGLTAAEAKIVEQLIQGVGAETIAAALRVSINTVRTHISHVYEKLGITCREELWRRLAPYRIN